MTNILVLSRNEATEHVHIRPYVMISFHDHDVAAAKLPEDPFRKSTLIIKVDDERDIS